MFVPIVVNAFINFIDVFHRILKLERQQHLSFARLLIPYCRRSVNSIRFAAAEADRLPETLSSRLSRSKTGPASERETRAGTLKCHDLANPCFSSRCPSFWNHSLGTDTHSNSLGNGISNQEAMGCLHHCWRIETLCTKVSNFAPFSGPLNAKPKHPGSTYASCTSEKNTIESTPHQGDRLD